MLVEIGVALGTILWMIAGLVIGSIALMGGIWWTIERLLNNHMEDWNE